jgi:tetratricopeptide (TPR) repeat protein
MDDFVSAYSAKLKNIEGSQSAGPQDVLAVLLARETISRTLAIGLAIEPAFLSNIQTCDRRLKDWAKSMPAAVRTQFPEWRTTLAKDGLAWWWSLDEQSGGTGRFRQVWHILTWAVMAIAISVLIEYVRRLSNLGPSVSATVIQGLLGLAGASAVFGFAKDRIAGLAAARREWRGEIWLAAVLSGLAIAASFASPRIAAHWARVGAEEHGARNLTEARTHLERAVRLEPEDGLAHYGFGSVLEDLREEVAAEAEYREALRWDNENFLTYIKLSRLSIVLRQNYVVALELAEEGWERFNRMVQAKKLNADEEAKLRYDLRKYRAWANLGLQRFKPAKDELDQAILECPKRAAAYCLRAVLSYNDSKDWLACRADGLSCIATSRGQEDELQPDWLSLAQSCVSPPETKKPGPASQRRR